MIGDWEQPPRFILEAFNALRSPEDDPDGKGRNFVLTTAEVGPEKKLHWVICAVHREKGGKTMMLPLFYHIHPGTEVKVQGQSGHAVALEDFVRGKT